MTLILLPIASLSRRSFVVASTRYVRGDMFRTFSSGKSGRARSKVMLCWLFANTRVMTFGCCVVLFVGFPLALREAFDELGVRNAIFQRVELDFVICCWCVRPDPSQRSMLRCLINICLERPSRIRTSRNSRCSSRSSPHCLVHSCRKMLLLFIEHLPRPRCLLCPK